MTHPISRILIALFLIIVISGCSTVKTIAIDNIPMSKEDVPVVINTINIKKQAYSDVFVDRLYKKLSGKYTNINIITNEHESNNNKLIVMPIELYITSKKASGDMSDITSTINTKLSYTFNNTSETLNYRTQDVYSMPFGWHNLILTLGTLGTYAMIQGEMNSRIAIGRVVDSAITSLCDKISDSSRLNVEIDNYLVNSASPSSLTLTVNFSDTSAFLPNNTLDAGEDAELTVKVKNTGKGTGFGTILEVNAENSKIVFDRSIIVGDIAPGETKEVKVSLKASLDLADGKTTFSLKLKEKRGYDAKKVVMNLPTAGLEAPRLEIVGTEINDANSGLAKGNGNGIPQSGETVELIAFIKNSGIGKAIGVNLIGAELTSGVQWVRDSALVGNILPGETVKAKLAFAIPRNFQSKEITSALKATDVRETGNAERKESLAVGRLAPELRFAWRIFSKGAEVKSITNAGDYELELALENGGQIAARDVAVSISSDSGATFSHRQFNAGEVKPQASGSPQRLTLSLPRTYTKKEALIAVDITQADFPSARSAITLPVEVKSPKLRYVPTLLGKGGGNTLQQGEQAILELQILNEGNLPADGVKVQLASNTPYLTVLGKTGEDVGSILPRGSEILKFTVSSNRRIAIGDAFLAVDVKQRDFAPLAEQYVLAIREEGADVIDVAAEERSKTTGVLISPANLNGPAISLKSPTVETTEESYRLAFDLTDPAHNIEPASIKVAVNGVSISLDGDAGATTKLERKKQLMIELRLREGVNSLIITARNTENNQARKEFFITRTIEDDVDSPPVTTGMRNLDAVAVIIGISKYKQMPSVDYARRDAETVRKYLVRTLGYDEARILTLLDEEADRTSLVTALYNKLGKRIALSPGKSDVFIYYSGHGMPDVDSEGAAKDAYLAPYDFDSEFTKETGIPLKELYAKMEKLGARSVTIAMDACFSGTTENGTLIKGISAVLEVSNPLLRTKNGLVFSASSGKEVSRWYEAKRHGYFTYYFLKGLSGKADANGDGEITKKELEEYISKNVAEQTQFKQNPTATGLPGQVVVRLK